MAPNDGWARVSAGIAAPIPCRQEVRRLEIPGRLITMSEASNLLEATLIGAATVFVGLGWWTLRRGIWISRLGPIVSYVSLLVFLYLIAGPLEWCLGLMPPINNPLYPTYLGIGGDAYGTNYAIYPRAMAWWSVMTLLVFGGIETGFLWARRRSPGLPQVNPGFALPRRQIVNLCGVMLSCGAIFAFGKFFATTGWDRIFWSELGRFEVSDNVEGVIKGIRWSLPVFISIGVLASLLMALRGNAMLFALPWTLSAIPFLVFASRGFSILAVAAGAAILLRYRKYRKVILVPLLIFMAVGAWLPLRLRQEPDTGLKVLWNVITSQGQESSRISGWHNTLILVLQNGGQGFGVFCQVFSDIDGPYRASDELPENYMLYSFSPMPSSVDGFAQKFADRYPRLNIYTPYCAFAEMLVYSPYAFFGIPLLASVVSVFFLVRPSNPTKLWVLSSVLVSLLLVNGCVQASQYATRTAGRFIYMGWLIGTAECIYRGFQFAMKRKIRSGETS
jgi:hypothetical protein